MEDLQGWLGERGDRQLPLPSQPQQQPQPQPNPQPVAVAAESWRRAESATRDIIGRIQSTVVSEERRRAVVEYVQKLIRGCVGSEVFPFGSVPLKTYLPDGDIDLTALGVPNAEDALARNVRSVLDGEEQKRDGEFEVKDVQYIYAEVKLVKCLVQNIVVDISFNQIGGLCTLCFLERVDRLIGKENLFKRSIILIKAWCYYESRILGAHHGLISTYALETLVLYIFHLFHSSLDGPLAVLYRFLDYYSKFDWDNYCISLHGPVPVSSLPELIAQPPENEGGDLLLSSEFLKSCVEMFSVPSRGSESSSRVFLQKHLNIVDPLKENNNLGRSVSKGNFYRIRSAFSYGARKLGRILLLPSENIGEEINVFFMNTLDRHGSGERPDVQDSFPRCLNDTEIDHMGESTVKKGKDDKLISESPTVDGALCGEVNKIKISGSDKELDMEVHSGNHLSNDCSAVNFFHSIKMETNGPGEAGVVSGGRLAGDAQDLATSRATISRNANETSEASSSTSETGGSPSGKAYHAPHSSYQFENVRGIGKLDHKSPRQARVSSDRDLVRPQSYETDSSSSNLSWLASNHVLPSSCMPNGRSPASCWSTSSSQSSHVVDSPSPKAKDNGTNGSAKSLNLVDLTGDYDTHYKNLEYARWCLEYMLGGVFLPNHQSSPSQNRNKHSWDIFHGQNMFVHMNANGVVPGPPFSPPGIYSMLHPIMSGAYATEDMPKPRGTGTYFPNMNYRTYRERQSSGRGRASVPTNQINRARNNGRPTMPADNLAEKVSHETHTQPQPRGYSVNGRGKPASLDLTLPLRSTMKGFPHANGFVNLHEGRLEFGSLGSVPYGSSSLEVGRKSDFASPRRQGSGQGIPFSTAHGQGSSLNSERPMQAYHLKDDDDFPPLTG